MKRILIKGGTVVNEDQMFNADIIIEDDRIREILRKDSVQVCKGASDNVATDSFDTIIDAAGCYVLPGVIDSHVHFRDPGLTHKADMETESRAAAYGGVTTVFDMPNTKPQTTTFEALRDKMAIGKEKMHVNYAFFPGATNTNIEELKKIDPTTIPGIKLFMGSSTGNMLVDKEEALDGIFAFCAEVGLVLMAHCEDTSIISQNMARIKELLGTDDPEITFHPIIRSEEACYASSSLGAKLARKHGTHFHIAHVTTAKELGLLGGNVTGEATIAHLMFSDKDYKKKGSLIKCNPAIKTLNDRDALRLALSVASGSRGSSGLNGSSGLITTIGTDHAPHTWEEKQGGCCKAMSGMPMIQFSLPSMLSLVDKEVITMPRMVELMAHNPARLFSVKDRGFLREGYKADIAIVRQTRKPWTVTKDCSSDEHVGSIQSKCGWSPLEGQQFSWMVMQTIVDGQLVFNQGVFNSNAHGELVQFNR